MWHGPILTKGRLLSSPLTSLTKLVQWNWPGSVVMGGCTPFGIHYVIFWNLVIWLQLCSFKLVKLSLPLLVQLTLFWRHHNPTWTRNVHTKSPSHFSTESFHSVQVWMNSMNQKSPIFMYRDLILSYEILILIFSMLTEFSFACRSFRDPYSTVLCNDFWRWVPVHIWDMKVLPRNKFENLGYWVLSKTNNKLSAIPINQAHEQENAYVKGSGGCVESPTAFRPWVLSGQVAETIGRRIHYWNW